MTGVIRCLHFRKGFFSATTASKGYRHLLQVIEDAILQCDAATVDDLYAAQIGIFEEGGHHHLQFGGVIDSSRSYSAQVLVKDWAEGFLDDGMWASRDSPAFKAAVEFVAGFLAQELSTQHFGLED